MLGLLTCGVLAAGCGGSTTWITGDEQRELRAPLPTTPEELRQQLVRLEQLLSVEETTGPALSERHSLACSRLRDLVFEGDYAAPSYGLSRWGYELVDRAHGWCGDDPRMAARLLERALAEQG